MATSSTPPPIFNPQQVMFNQLATGQRPLLTTLTREAQRWYNTRPPANVDALQPKFGETDALYGEVMRVLSDTHARQRTSLQIIDRIRDALADAPEGSDRAHQLETLLRYLISSMQRRDNQQVGIALDRIVPTLPGGARGTSPSATTPSDAVRVTRPLSSTTTGSRGRRRRDFNREPGPSGSGSSSETKTERGGGKSKTRKAAKRGKKRKGGYKFTRAANSRRSLRMKTRKLKSLTQKSPKKKQKKKHGKKHGKKHDKKSKSRKARQGKHHKRGKRR
jgi:hypothetical protein